MKGYTDFATGFLGASFVATKPIGKQKYMDWEKVKQIVKENPGSIVYAGLMEDWSNTSGLIYAKGKYYKGYVFGTSNWATPIVDVDGEEIECYVHEKPENFTANLPSWWGEGEKLYDEWDFGEE